VSGHERGAPGGMKIAAVSVGFPVQGFRGCGHKGGTGVPAPDCGSAAIPSRPAATPRPAQKRTVTGRMPVSPWRRSTRRLCTREDLRLALEEENVEARPVWKPMFSWDWMA
jgi:hypothetical protein